ncbi:uncharacterized protein BDZ99DRAFT_422765 [Mytilinidion resinicola]|uniref:Galactose oxidase n=1 Tax=Mytilinidion resinicola TaxID=574789 RepID=A0A6A6YCF4_9PEZI|nr:uncharacterized protein BDZ99DRAFT_422765 [Mytilinidion resinicola]KAF2806380.1 hypothetical protein BDZ99DRAFT_422765 [Mytilinidion resinicola]
MEVAAGAVAFEAATTTLEGGAIAGYAIAQKTMPLRATFTQIATSPQTPDRSSLCRLGHTVSVVDGKAYIFGGTTTGAICTNEMHILTLPPKSSETGAQYKCIPALSVEHQKEVPPSRCYHSATVYGEVILVYGGRDDDGQSLKEGSKLWKFSTKSLQWSCLQYAEDEEGDGYAVYGHGATIQDDQLVIYGGVRNTPSEDQYRSPTLMTLGLKVFTKRVAKLAIEPATCFPANLVAVDDAVYTINGDDELSTNVRQINLEAAMASSPAALGEERGFREIPIPSNPLTPGPKGPRDGAALVPISTGHGRHYLIYMFGMAPAQAVLHANSATPAKNSQTSSFCSDAWTLQIPSSDMSLSSAKDKARDALGMDSGRWSWSEVEIKTNTGETEHEGKVHPGPRAFAAYAAIDDRRILVWGGQDATHDAVGDGWIIRFE